MAATIDHSKCDHPRTRRAREACREARELANQPAPEGISQELWETLDDGAKRSWLVSMQALEKSKELIADDNTRDAKNAALTMAIHMDKSMMLSGLVSQVKEREVRLTEAQVELTNAVWEQMLDDVGLQSCRSLKRLFGKYLRQAADDGVVISDQELASAAREELARMLVPERLALPASTASQDPDDQPEIVDAEIVEDGNSVQPAKPRRLGKKRARCTRCGAKGRYRIKSSGTVICAACRDELRDERRQERREALVGAQHWDDEAGGWGAP